MVEITYQMVLSTLQTAGILVGIFYYITTLRNQGKNRMVEMVFQRMQERDLEYYKIRRDIEPLMEGWATNEEYFEKYHYSKTPDLANKRVLVINHLSSWGFLLREGLIELDFVTRMHAPWFIIRIWESFAPITIEQRDIDPEYGKDFEYLYNAVKAKYPQVSADTKFSFDRVHDRVMKQRASESDKTQ